MSSHHSPLVSIGLPVYNGEGLLSRAIDSVLQQDYDNFALVICDNASTDRTEQICRRYAAADSRIRYFRNERNIGATPNFRRAFELATGEYFKWLSHDDWMAPQFISRCIAPLIEDPRLAISFPGLIKVLHDGRGMLADPIRFDLSQEENPRKRHHKLIWTRYEPIALDYGLMRASCLRETGLLEDFPSSEWLMLAEMALRGTFYQVEEPLTYFQKRSPADERDWWVYCNPANARRLQFLLFRRIGAHLRAVAQSPLSTPAKFLTAADAVAAITYWHLDLFARQKCRKLLKWLTGRTTYRQRASNFVPVELPTATNSGESPAPFSREDARETPNYAAVS